MILPVRPSLRHHAELPGPQPDPDGYVIAIREGGKLKHLMDASVRQDKSEALADLALWRQGRDRRRFVLCAVTIVEER